jgi:hypothetical protein
MEESSRAPRREVSCVRKTGGSLSSSDALRPDAVRARRWPAIPSGESEDKLAQGAKHTATAEKHIPTACERCSGIACAVVLAGK